MVLDLAVHQHAIGYRVAVASPPSGMLPDGVRTAGLELYAWSASRQPDAGLVRELRTLAEIVRAFDPDVVHLHSSKAGLVGRLVIRGRRPTVFQPHAWSFLAVTGVRARLARGWERCAARWSDRIVAVSTAECEVGRLARVGGFKVVIHNGVDTEAVVPIAPDSRVERRGKLGVSHAALVVCVGRICRQKGQDVALAAWPAVRDRFADAQLVFVGDGPDRAILAAANAPGVQFVGDSAEVASWLGVADVVIAPSRWEGQSLALLEAMASGASIVATDVAGVRDALSENGGAVVPVEDPQALAAAIVERLGDHSRRVNEGRVARARAVAEFDIGRMTTAMAELYDSVLSERGSARR